MEFNLCNIFKYVYSTALMLFSVVLVMGLIFTGQTKVANDVSPALAFIILWVAVIWLTMVEGSQASLVGLPPVEQELYKDSHPKTLISCRMGHKGDNLDRYLMGRQLLVVVVVFAINNSGGPIPGSQLWNLPEIVIKIFLEAGIAMILLTANIGQLMSQVNASHCMLDYINNYFALFTVYVSLLIESTGLLHSCYLAQYVFAYMCKQPVVSNEPPRDAIQQFYYWGRVLLSLAILGFCFAVTIEALFTGKTTMWGSVPGWAALIIFFIFLSIVGLLEGMQIAFFAVTKLPKAERASSKFAVMTCDLLFKGNGHNLPGFMVGRQLCVVSCMFFIARVTSLNVVPGTGENVFGVSDGLQTFFNTGLLGALITTIVGSITWQLVASAFPVMFLTNPMVYVFLRICLLFDAAGICKAAWLLAKIQKFFCKFKRDEEYIGTPEERAKMRHRDHDQDQGEGPGHPRIPTFPVGADVMPKSASERIVTRMTIREEVDGELDLEDNTGGESDDEKPADGPRRKADDVISC